MLIVAREAASRRHSRLMGNGSRPGRRIPHMLLVLLLGVVWAQAATSAPAAPPALAPGTPGTAPVSNPQEFLSALSDPAVSTIHVMKPFAMPHGRIAKPAVVNRQLLVTSPVRALIDWCDRQCRAGSMSKTPLIILGKVRKPLFWRGPNAHSQLVSCKQALCLAVHTLTADVRITCLHAELRRTLSFISRGELCLVFMLLSCRERW